MTKQEKIREGIAKIIGENIGAACSEFGGDPHEEIQLEVNEILSYLHSQGVVLKVDGDEPYCKEHPHTVNLNCFTCGIKVGKRHPVAVESLID